METNLIREFNITGNAGGQPTPKQSEQSLYFMRKKKKTAKKSALEETPEYIQ